MNCLLGSIRTSFPTAIKRPSISVQTFLGLHLLPTQFLGGRPSTEFVLINITAVGVERFGRILLRESCLFLHTTLLGIEVVERFGHCHIVSWRNKNWI